jgi:hypothetical protein
VATPVRHQCDQRQVTDESRTNRFTQSWTVPALLSSVRGGSILRAEPPTEGCFDDRLADSIRAAPVDADVLPPSSIRSHGVIHRERPIRPADSNREAKVISRGADGSFSLAPERVEQIFTLDPSRSLPRRFTFERFWRFFVVCQGLDQDVPAIGGLERQSRVINEFAFWGRAKIRGIRLALGAPALWRE